MGLIERSDDRFENALHVGLDIDYRELGTVSRRQRAREVRLVSRGRAGAGVSCGECVRHIARERHARHNSG